jgi:hypothetical protein
MSKPSDEWDRNIDWNRRRRIKLKLFTTIKISNINHNKIEHKKK